LLAARLQREELFLKGLDWVQAQENPLVETTRVGLVLNGFSQINDCTARPQFIIGLVRGLAGGLAPEVRAQFATWLFQEAGERMPNPNGKKTALFAPFIYKMHYFTKTGSGQTQGKLKKKCRFPSDPLGTYWSERTGALDSYAYDPSNEVDTLDYAAKAEPPVLLTPHIQSAADTVMPWLSKQVRIGKAAGHTRTHSQR
jgi:hypothetical protein